MLDMYPTEYIESVIIDTVIAPPWRWYFRWRYRRGYPVPLTPTYAAVKISSESGVIFERT